MPWPRSLASCRSGVPASGGADESPEEARCRGEAARRAVRLGREGELCRGLDACATASQACPPEVLLTTAPKKPVVVEKLLAVPLGFGVKVHAAVTLLLVMARRKECCRRLL
ncbi:hypothetical protein PHYPSEUDO_014205 [Phytophthora pseudosyringae]|uniref:Uncharacterized protein n=1 Tax=Phytophthora pseudosyringae TaxID=221518 RepID=A0A8T1V577_9STRA|nr:hypothetical protein PHYPSEUDO_014205 [Phytophthora pseudosyringae]